LGNHSLLGCTSGEIYNALTQATTAQNATTATVAIFLLLILVGAGLLVFAALFERLAIAVALAVVIFFSVFVAVYTWVADGGKLSFSSGGSSNEIDATQLCDGPLVAAIVAVVLAGLFAVCIGSLIQRCSDSARAWLVTIVKFVVGFAVGLLGMLVLFQALERTSWALTQQPDCGPLWGYVGGTVVVAIVFGELSLYVFTYVDLILKCITGAHAFSYGVSGLSAAASSTGKAMPDWAYTLMFAFLATASAAVHLRLLLREAREAQSKAKGTAPTEQTPLVKADGGKSEAKAAAPAILEPDVVRAGLETNT
jgi:hypothetical protein